MATVPTQGLPSAGLAATYNAASAGGDRVAPGSVLHVKNRGGASINVGLVTVAVYDGDLAIADRSIAVAAGEANDRFIPVGPLYADPADGLCGITWSATASVTFAVIRP